jgi:[acyl-carrier-protein] S-malonyltransferase
MIDVALIFPGQGSQFVGMGQEFYENSFEAKEVFQKVDAVFRGELMKVILEGPTEKLTSTAFCQPAIFTMSLAALSALRAHPKNKNLFVKFVAGLSLGEYSALAASTALDLEGTIRLIQRRAEFMEEATKITRGKMAAIIGLDKETVIKICKLAEAEVANFNSPQQVVITGQAEKVDLACQKLQAAGAKSVIPLEVSGAFHSSLMRPAEKKFAEELQKVTFMTPDVPVVSNVDGLPAADPEKIRLNLTKQITSSVQWVDSIHYMAGEGVKTFIEIGPGKVLKGLIRRIDPALTVHNIEKPSDLEALPF